MITEELKLSYNAVDGNIDGGTSVALIKRHHEHTILDILRHLGCTFDNRWANVHEEERYQDTGLASYRRSDEGSLIISIDVGCWCSHDCCGHLCSLSFEISLTDDYYVIIKREGYNC